jgi:hypothetical protein
MLNMFLFSLFVFVSAAGQYFRILTGQYFSIWTGPDQYNVFFRILIHLVHGTKGHMAIYGPGCHPQNIIWTEAKLSTIYYCVGDRPVHKLPLIFSYIDRSIF